ncbi:hypothetical protein L218DRAFT_1000422 [Marasmius fiardii PR-910]|nr:hypothetical protein L218DRAFT_1000422 [Marasmius fiardii PR-910]
MSAETPPPLATRHFIVNFPAYYLCTDQPWFSLYKISSSPRPSPNHLTFFKHPTRQMDAFSILNFSSLFSLGSSEYDVTLTNTSTISDAPAGVATSQSTSSLEDLPPLVDEENPNSKATGYCVVA